MKRARSAALALLCGALLHWGGCSDTPEFHCVESLSCPGALAPSWQLEDFQPQSPRFGETYGLEHFRGQTTVVALLAGG